MVKRCKTHGFLWIFPVKQSIESIAYRCDYTILQLRLKVGIAALNPPQSYGQVQVWTYSRHLHSGHSRSFQQVAPTMDGFIF